MVCSAPLSCPEEALAQSRGETYSAMDVFASYDNIIYSSSSTLEGRIVLYSRTVHYVPMYYVYHILFPQSEVYY